MSKGNLLRSSYFFYRSFATLNFTILLALVIVLFASQALTFHKIKTVAMTLREAPAEPQPEPVADEESFEALRTHEERQTYLRQAFLQMARKRTELENRQAAILARLEEQKAELDQQRQAVDTKRTDHEKSVEAFRKETEMYSQTASTAGFQTNLKGYASMKAEELAPLLLARTDAESDIYIGKVLELLEDKQRAKLLLAMMKDERGGKERVLRILERIEKKR